MQSLACDFGGMYTYPQLSSGPAVYTPHCEKDAVVRYRSQGMESEHWGYRCLDHSLMLDSNYCEIEEL